MRALCPYCHYPESRCLCEHLSPIDTKIRIDILQHPSETKAAKNTAKLVSLCIPNVRIWIGEHSKDFSQLKESLNRDEYNYLIYPSDAASPIEALAFTHPSSIRCLLIDATWRKAHKIYCLNPWLHSLRALKFSDLNTAYRIRKAPKLNQISTLEAVIHTLDTLDPTTDTQPLFKVFEHFQEHFYPSASKKSTQIK